MMAVMVLTVTYGYKKVKLTYVQSAIDLCTLRTLPCSCLPPLITCYSPAHSAWWCRWKWRSNTIWFIDCYLGI